MESCLHLTWLRVWCKVFFSEHTEATEAVNDRWGKQQAGQRASKEKLEHQTSTGTLKSRTSRGHMPGSVTSLSQTGSHSGESSYRRLHLTASKIGSMFFSTRNMRGVLQEGRCAEP